MKDFLKKLIARKKEEIKNLQECSNASTDINEVRFIGETLLALRDEITELETKLEELGDEGAGAAGDGGEGERGNVPANAQLRNAQVVGSFAAPQQRAANVDPCDTEEYRNAFMNYVCRNVPIPAEIRQEGTTATGDVGAVIPTTILNEIIQNLESYGNVYALVRKLDVQGGVAIPILSLKPEATWIGETTPSKDQKLQANQSVTFSYFGVECKIAQTLLVNVTTLKMFQQIFVPLATEAIVKAVEIAIFKGNGTTQPLGVTKDARIPESNIIEITPEEVKSWGGWHTAVKAKIKKAYRNGTFFMNQGTFDGYIDGMEDENGQPVGRTNYGINGEETYRFMGKAVETVEDECISSWDDAATGDVVAVYMNPKDYIINSNMKMINVKWTDNENNQVKNKAILICDGKLGDTNGVLIIKKGVASV